MIDKETMQFLQKLPGGEWGSEEKKNKLYDLVIQCSKDFPDTTLLSVELGIFGGASLFCMAMAHKELNNGFAMGIDAYDNKAPLEGVNTPENDEWWGKLDIQSIYKEFRKAIPHYKWEGKIEHLVTHSLDADTVNSFRDDSITLLHQDSNHASEIIIKELDAWAPKIKMGGYWIVDDTNWPSTKEGYAKLPEYGFELVEQYDTWAIYKKTGKIIGKITDESPEYEKIDTPKIKGNPIIEIMNQVALTNSVTVPLFGKVMPILLFLPDTEEWLKRYHDCLIHFQEQDITPFSVAGIHARAFGIQGTHRYMRDAYARIRAKYRDGLSDTLPEELKEQKYNGDGRTGGYLSHYMLYNIMAAMAYDYFLVMEDDCRFIDGWKDKLEQALKDAPNDFDFLFVGSACAEDKEPVNVKGDVWHFPKRKGKADWYPQTGYCYIVAKKALPILIATQRDTADQVDVSLIYEAFPYLNIYAILPRISEQFKTELPK